MLAEYDSKETLFCECKGIEFCERENRSISCRTFPLEPYLDTRGVLVGLVFMKEFTGKCPLTLRAKDIRQEFIDSHFIFWEKLLFRLDSEYETFWNSSKSYRRSRAQTGKKFPIFFPSHLQGKKYLESYLWISFAQELHNKESNLSLHFNHRVFEKWILHRISVP